MEYTTWKVTPTLLTKYHFPGLGWDVTSSCQGRQRVRRVIVDRSALDSSYFNDVLLFMFLI